MELGKLQRAFLQELRGQISSELRRQIVADGMSPAQRLAIYRNNALGACRKALDAVYPVCRSILGDACFGQLAREYIASCPSAQGDLNSYGASWPEFLRQRLTLDAALGQLPYLGDLARLEWHYHAAYFAADDSGFDFQKLQRLAPWRQGDICWHCSASLAVMQSDFPLYAIWQGNREGRALAAVVGCDQPQYLAIYRSGFVLAVDEIERSDFQLLRDILAGKTMAQLLQTRSAAAIDALLPTWVQRGWVCGFSLLRESQ